jgi:glutaredoxin
VNLILYSGKNCHLCHRLEKLVAPHLDALRRNGIELQLTKRDIYENNDWRKLYKLRIPVLTLDDKVIIEGNPSEDEVRQAIEALR